MSKNVYMSFRDKRKKQIKIVLWIVTIFISLGLVGSSVLWSLGGKSSQNSQATSNQQQDVDMKQVISELEEKAKANPQDTENLESLASAYQQTNEKDKALETYKKIIELDPQNTRVGLKLAMTYFLTDKYDDAENQIKNVLEVEPQNQDAHYYYGLILGYGKKDYQAGIVELEKYVDLAKTGKDVQVAKDLIKEWQGLTAQQQ